MTLKRFSVAAIVALGILSFCTGSASAQPGGGNGGGAGGGGTKGPSYAIVPLDDAGYYTMSGNGPGVVDIADSGNVVGEIFDPIREQEVAAYWAVEGTSSTLIPFWRALTLEVGGVNNLDEIVGWDVVIEADGLPKLTGRYWAGPKSKPLTLPTLGMANRYSRGQPYGINDAGFICGVSIDQVVSADGNSSSFVYTPVLWSVVEVDGEPQIKGPFALPTPAGEEGVARALTECDAAGKALVVGSFLPQGGPFEGTAPVEWSVTLSPDGSAQVAPAASVLEETLGEALAINELGVSAGRAGGKGRVWSDGGFQILADYPSRKIKGVTYRALTIHTAYGIGDDGLVVGTASDISGFQEAVIWPSATAQPILLEDFLPTKDSPFLGLIEAKAINNSGVISGDGFDNIGRFGFLAIPQ